jgi:hypothetical protein
LISNSCTHAPEAFWRAISARGATEPVGRNQPSTEYAAVLADGCATTPAPTTNTDVSESPLMSAVRPNETSSGGHTGGHQAAVYVPFCPSGLASKAVRPLVSSSRKYGAAPSFNTVDV